MISAGSPTGPPQTYSRLFRPWDGKSANNDDEKLVLTECKTKLEDIPKISVISERSLLKDQSKIAQQFQLNGRTCDDTIFAAKNLHGELSSSPFYANYPDFIGSGGGSYLSMDPFSASAMEQEYARVLAEEAQAKILNARKQRPKKFKCPHCDVAFSNNGQLKGHVRIHTGERPFKCDEANCGKTFTRNEELTRHKRIHTGLRPYGCTTCGKRFGRRDHLKKHTKTHFVQERFLAPAVFLPLYPYLYGY